MPVVVLDRDGVINHDSDDYVKSEEEWIPIPGSIEAISDLSQAGYKIAIATNQSGIARGLFDEVGLARMHGKLRNLVEDAGGFIDGIFYCPHLPQEKCRCRKPQTGLLEQIELHLSVSLAGCYFIGDSHKDIQAALSYGLQPILVETGKGAITVNTLQEAGTAGIPFYPNLREAASWILSQANT